MSTKEAKDYTGKTVVKSNSSDLRYINNVDNLPYFGLNVEKEATKFYWRDFEK
jgi:hypothetical protein